MTRSIFTTGLPFKKQLTTVHQRRSNSNSQDRSEALEGRALEGSWIRRSLLRLLAIFPRDAGFVARYNHTDLQSLSTLLKAVQSPLLSSFQLSQYPRHNQVPRCADEKIIKKYQYFVIFCVFNPVFSSFCSYQWPSDSVDLVF